MRALATAALLLLLPAIAAVQAQAPTVYAQCGLWGSVAAADASRLVVEVVRYRRPAAPLMEREPVNVTWDGPPGSAASLARVGSWAELEAGCDSLTSLSLRDVRAATLYPDNASGAPLYAAIVVEKGRRLPAVGGAAVELDEGRSAGACTGCCCAAEHPARLLRDGAAVGAERALRGGQSLCAEGFRVRMLEASVYRADAGAECSGKPCRSRAELVVGPVSQEGCAVEDLLAEVDGIVARLDDPIVERAMDRSRADALGRLEKGDVAGARAAAERALERARRLDTQARSVNVAAAILATLGVVAIAYVWLNRERKKAASIF